eukprot:TRINITY_DN8800_c0_g1_i6.p1 TRINITY_DN8800_c0_g1~~TRINITY_DN8800_c0_g1_i6.p1  ORF type:complete len:508 (+),score=116.91 TRINITY_DN8800_c0_g1_i6:57-1580(+)
MNLLKCSLLLAVPLLLVVCLVVYETVFQEPDRDDAFNKGIFPTENGHHTLQPVLSFKRLHNMLVVSSYFDVKPLQIHEDPKIRLIALTRSRKVDGFSCVWVDAINKQLHLFADAKVFFPPDDHNTSFIVAIFSCSVPKHANPVLVSLSSEENQEQPLAWIEVAHSQNNVTDFIRNFGRLPEANYSDFFIHPFAVCVPPVFGDRYDTLFVQWMEFYRLMGATQVYVYDFNASRQLARTFKRYSDERILTVIQFPLPSCQDMDQLGLFVECKETHPYGYVHYFAQVSAMYDCMLRTTGMARWTAFIDIDEFLVPRKHSDLVSFFSGVIADTEVANSHIVGFQYSNFYSQPCLRPLPEFPTGGHNVSATDLILPLHQAIQQLTWGFEKRSKNVMNTLLIENLGIHRDVGPFYNQQDPSIISNQLVSKNQRCEDFFNRSAAVLSGGSVKGRHPRDVVYVHPEESTMFHLKRMTPMTREECAKLYSSGLYVQDALIWSKFGKDLVAAISRQL